MARDAGVGPEGQGWASVQRLKHGNNLSFRSRERRTTPETLVLQHVSFPVRKCNEFSQFLIRYPFYFLRYRPLLGSEAWRVTVTL